MRIAYTNLVDATAVTLIASTADASYPVANIQDQRLSTRWRTTAITSQSVIVDLGSSQAITTAAILGHNITATATVTVTGSDELNASAWSDWRQTGSALAVSASVGVALAAISSTRVAYIDAQTEQLQTYSWSGSVWTTLGSALTIVGIGVPALATLTASQIAFIDNTIGNLSTYAFSGSVWSLVGSALGVASGTQALAGLTASTIAFVDSTNDQLRTYSWSGSVWTTLGSALSVTTEYPSLAALTASVITYLDGTNDEMKAYAWSGSVWSQLGTALSIAIGVPALCALTTSRVAMIDSSIRKLQTYSWSGSVFTALGQGIVDLGWGSPMIAALNDTNIALVDLNNDQLRTYRGNSTLTVSETLSYDADVMLKFITSTSRRYWQVLVENTTTGSYIEMGRVWLGTYITVEPSSLVDFRVIKKRSDTVIYGKHRQKWADPGYGWRRFELSFPETDASMLTQIETMYDTVGNHSSFLFCNFDLVRDFTLTEPCYVSIDGDIGFVNRGRYKATYTLALEEDR